MKQLLSTKYSAGAFNTAMLVLRLGLGILMINHGYDKLVHFATYQKEFMNFLGIGSTASLALVVFSEFFCSLFLIIGLLTRLSSIPLIITMLVIIFMVNNGQIFEKAETATLYLTGYIVLLLVGPGKISVDGMMGK